MDRLFEEVIELATQGLSLRKISKMTGISQQKARRILISSHAWSSPTADEIAKMVDSGLSVSEISQKMGVSKTAVFSYLPYTKGSYRSDSPTRNAMQIRKHREKNPDK